MTVKPKAGPPPEPHRGGCFLIVKDFAVRDPAVVINRGVNVRVPDPRPAFVGAVLVAASPVGSSAATGRDLAELFDVDMDQITRSGVFVASDHPAGGPVHPRQPVHLVADQHPVHC